MSNSANGSSSNFSFTDFNNCSEKPNGCNFVATKKTEASKISNGTASTSEESVISQNGASCSYMLTNSLASCSSHLPVDEQNGECSGEKFSAKGRTLSSEENDSKCTDKKIKTACFLDSESSSGNEGEEGFSGDDCCIYTYKGDQFADLPNSLFSVDMVMNGGSQVLRENHRKINHRREVEDRNNLGSSPEMDYLEMDFDPGPSLEQDSEEDNACFERKTTDSPISEFSNEFFPTVLNEDLNILTEKNETFQETLELGEPGPSYGNALKQNQSHYSDCNSNSYNRIKVLFNECCSDFCNADEKGDNCDESRQKKHENKSDKLSFSNSLGEKNVNKNLVLEKKEKISSETVSAENDLKLMPSGIMLWTEQEAVSKQVTLGSSEVSCAATAVINAMLALKMRISMDKVKQGISSKLRTNSASIPQYLISRSYAGAAHENLIRGIHHASHGLLYARFFHMYPRREIVLTNWLADWMKKGAVPIATMNVQKDSSEDCSFDMRQHQMIFGVNSKGIFLTNPLECLQEEELWNRLISPSVLKIKRSEIISRWTPDSNLKPLMYQSDDRWKKMNVLGQVVNIIRESSDPSTREKFFTQHLLIPASSGITLVIPRHSPSYEALASTADLPLTSTFNSN